MENKFSILAADKLADEGLDFIRSQPDCELVNKPGLSEDELAEIVHEHDAMIVRSGVQVTAKVLENSGKLKVIGRAGVGVDNIDLDAATAKGILVLNSAEASTITTAEHAFTLMMAMCRNIGHAHKVVSEGGWDRSKFVGRQLCGKALGVVGFGRIGQTVAERALAFGMDVVAYDPFINAKTMMDGKVRMFTDFEEMLPHADILTFHVPLNDATKGMLNTETFKLCRKNVMVVNASRGGVVCEESLVKACDDGTCAAAAIDVYSEEPPPVDSPLRNHPKITTTPHLGASTAEAQEAVTTTAAASCLAYLRGEGIRGAVNAGGFRVDLDEQQLRFVDLAKRMATLAQPLTSRGVAKVSIEMEGDELSGAAGTIERTALVALLQAHLDTPLNIINVSQVAESRGIKTKTTTSGQHAAGVAQLTLEIEGPPGAVDKNTHQEDVTRKLVGRVYDDHRPRIIEINGYHMDMIPSGAMILIRNEDRPGMIGYVGSLFGNANVNIADMTISRREETALMVLKVDREPDEALLTDLKQKPGILHVSLVKLPEE